MELYFVSPTQHHDTGKDSFIFMRSEELELINIRIEVFWIRTPCSGESVHQLSDERSYSLAFSLTYVSHILHLYHRIASRSAAADGSAPNRAVINLSHIIFAY